MYLCGETALRRHSLDKYGITDVINCTIDVPNRTENGIKCLQIKLPDSPLSRIDVHFDRVADTIQATRSAGGKVLVHCESGVSRSATLCIAFLMKHEKMTLIEAHKLVRSKRRIIRPNPGFWKQLTAYEQKLRGRKTVDRC